MRSAGRKAIDFGREVSGHYGRMAMVFVVVLVAIAVSCDLLRFRMTTNRELRKSKLFVARILASAIGDEAKRDTEQRQATEAEKQEQLLRDDARYW